MSLALLTQRQSREPSGSGGRLGIELVARLSWHQALVIVCAVKRVRTLVREARKESTEDPGRLARVGATKRQGRVERG